jgi:hypothetical protein
MVREGEDIKAHQETSTRPHRIVREHEEYRKAKQEVPRGEIYIQQNADYPNCRLADSPQQRNASAKQTPLLDFFI